MRGNEKQRASDTALRRGAAKVFFVFVVSAQFYFVVAAYDNPHKHFGYQPFSQSSTWESSIVRVLHSGERIDIRDGWEGYRWSELVRERGLDAPWVRRSAPSGVESTLDFFQQALNWVATHTPRDRETRYFEAHVRYIKNRGAPQTVVMRSVERPAAP